MTRTNESLTKNDPHPKIVNWSAPTVVDIRLDNEHKEDTVLPIDYFPAKRTRVLCPFCKTALNAAPSVDTRECSFHLDGTPVGKEMEYMASLFDYCPTCGFVSLTTELDCGQEMDIFAEIPDSTKAMFLSEGNDVCRRLLLATCRYTRLPSVWLYLFRYCWMTSDMDVAKEMARQFLYVQQDLLDCVEKETLSAPDVEDVVVIADVLRKTGRLKDAVRLINMICRSKPENNRAWMPAATAETLRLIRHACEVKDVESDY